METRDVFVYDKMKYLISIKFYKTKEEALNKLRVFYMCGDLTDEEYVELKALAEQVYAPPVVLPTEN